MAQAVVHSTLAYHKKLERFMKDAEIGRVVAVGHLVFLWWWCDDNAPNGVLPKLNDWEIASKALYLGDPKKFVSALIDAVFLDKVDGGLVIHDQEEWLTEAARKKIARRRTDVRTDVRTSGGQMSGHASGQVADTTESLSLSLPVSGTTGEKTTTTAAVKAEKKLSPQETFVLRFKAFYEEVVKKPFKYDRHHFIVAKKLIDEFGFDLVVEKTKTLAAMCKDRLTWFTQSGWADFSIEKLSKQWNLIIPDAVKPSKEVELAEELLRARERRLRADEIIQRGGIRVN